MYLRTEKTVLVNCLSNNLNSIARITTGSDTPDNNSFGDSVRGLLEFLHTES